MLLLSAGAIFSFAFALNSFNEFAAAAVGVRTVFFAVLLFVGASCFTVWVTRGALLKTGLFKG
ncbi:hypothetical protein D3C86_1757850 [compost metagenome]